LNKNPFPRSHKYDELIKIYSDIAKNGGYKRDGTFIPPDKLFGKSGQVKFKDLLKKLLAKYKIKSNSRLWSRTRIWESKIDGKTL
jgi:hypothetical protein